MQSRSKASDSTDSLITISKAASLLRVSARTLRRWDVLGLLPAHRGTSARREYRRAEVEAFARAKSTRRSSAPTHAVLGRARDLRALSALLKSDSVTLVGPPGVGKSTIGQALARTMRSVVCDLSDVSDVETMLSDVASAVGRPVSAGEPREVVFDEIRRALASTRLLVLDNVDMLGRDAQLEVARLARVPSLRVLAISHSPLMLDDERVYRLGPLSTAHAAQLFLQSARRLRATPAVFRSPACVRSIVDRLDCIPLAIECAAGLTARFGPRELLAMLSDERWLSSASTSPNDHNAVLDRSLALSWERLTPPEQLLLRECAAFEGWFDLPLATRVASASDPRAAEASLDALVQKNLLVSRATTTTREYRLLTIVRARVLGKSPAGFDAHRTASGHANALLRAIATTDVDPYLEPSADERACVRLRRDDFLVAVEHLRAHQPSDAVRLALALARVMEAEGPHTIQLRVLATASECASRLVASEQIDVHIARARAMRWRAPYSEAESYARKAVALALETGDLGARARAYEVLADISSRRGALESSFEYASVAIDCAVRSGEVGAEVFARLRASLVARQRGSFADSEQHARYAYKRCLERGYRHGLGSAQLALGAVRLESGALDEAATLVTNAREIFVATHDRRRECLALNWLASIEMARARDAEALECLHLVARYERVVDALAMGYVRLNRGTLLIATGRLDDARADIVSASATFEAHECGGHRAIAHGLLAVIDAHQGRADEAEAALRAATATLEGLAPDATLGRSELVTLRAIVACAFARSARAAGELALEQRWVGEADALRRELGAATRRAHPVLQRLLDRSLAELSGRAHAIVVARDGSWLIGGDGVRHSLVRRRPLKNVLSALASTDANARLSLTELERAGWPGEKMTARAAANRTWVALSQLRAMGLGDAIERTREGYRLHPSVTIAAVSDEALRTRRAARRR